MTEKELSVVSSQIRRELLGVAKRFGRRNREFVGKYLGLCVDALRSGDFCFWGGMVMHNHNCVVFDIEDIVIAVASLNGLYDIIDCYCDSSKLDYTIINSNFRGLTDKEREEEELLEEIKSYEDWIKWGDDVPPVDPWDMVDALIRS